MAFTAVRGGGLGGGRNLLPRKTRNRPGIRGTDFGPEVKGGDGCDSPAEPHKLDRPPADQGPGSSPPKKGMTP